MGSMNIINHRISILKEEIKNSSNLSKEELLAHALLNTEIEIKSYSLPHHVYDNFFHILGYYDNSPLGYAFKTTQYKQKVEKELIFEETKMETFTTWNQLLSYPGVMLKIKAPMLGEMSIYKIDSLDSRNNTSLALCEIIPCKKCIIGNKTTFFSFYGVKDLWSPQIFWDNNSLIEREYIEHDNILLWKSI